MRVAEGDRHFLGDFAEFAKAAAEVTPQRNRRSEGVIAPATQLKVQVMPPPSIDILYSESQTIGLPPIE
jgi:hypothetical protein